MMDQYAQINNIKLHYLEHPGGEPPLVLLPGLTANAHIFDGLIQAGLSPRFHTAALDFRGRGLSDKPATGYGMEDHAADVLGLLDELGLEQAVLCGQSFGGLIAFYMAARFPDRVSRLVIIDSSILLITERTRQMLKASLDRLGQRMPSMAAYIAAMKQMPYLDGYWDDSLETYFRSDVQVNEDGSVQALAARNAIEETIDMEFVEPWSDYIARIRQPTLLLNALGSFGPPGSPPLLPADLAHKTVESLADCRYVEIPGNHITMVFGDNAAHVVEAITAFVKGNDAAGAT